MTVRREPIPAEKGGVKMRKNIYIRDEDQELFEKAEALGGENFSAMIAEAVRQFVEVEQAKAEGMEEVELKVGIACSRGVGDLKKVKFIGKKIADVCCYSGQTSSRDDRGTDFTLYLTKKEKFLLYRLFWSRWENEDNESWYKIYDSMSQVMSVDGIPCDLLQEAGEALGVDTAEYLDI